MTLISADSVQGRIVNILGFCEPYSLRHNHLSPQQQSRHEQYRMNEGGGTPIKLHLRTLHVSQNIPLFFCLPNHLKMSRPFSTHGMYRNGPQEVWPPGESRPTPALDESWFTAGAALHLFSRMMARLEKVQTTFQLLSF